MQVKELAGRLRVLIDAITINTYNNICRGLFEKDKNLFSFLITVRIMVAGGEISEAEFSFFLTMGAGLLNQDTAVPNPTGDLLSDMQWDALQVLSDVCAPMRGVAKSVAADNFSWKR